MARTERLQPIPETPQVQPQEDARPADVPRRITDLAQFPLRLGPKELQRIFEIKKSRFAQLKKAGRFDRFLLLPRIGHDAWSRELVQRYLDGDVSARKFAPHGSTFGRGK